MKLDGNSSFSVTGVSSADRFANKCPLARWRSGVRRRAGRMGLVRRVCLGRRHVCPARHHENRRDRTMTRPPRTDRHHHGLALRLLTGSVLARCGPRCDPDRAAERDPDRDGAAAAALRPPPLRLPEPRPAASGHSRHPRPGSRLPSRPAAHFRPGHRPGSAWPGSTWRRHTRPGEHLAGCGVAGMTGSGRTRPANRRRRRPATPGPAASPSPRPVRHGPRRRSHGRRQRPPGPGRGDMGSRSLMASMEQSRLVSDPRAQPSVIRRGRPARPAGPSRVVGLQLCRAGAAGIGLAVPGRWPAWPHSRARTGRADHRRRLARPGG